MSTVLRRVRPAGAVLVSALLLGACAGVPAERQNQGVQPATGRMLPGPGPKHIHGLGVDRDQLFLATHRGMFTVAPGQTRAVGYGSDRRDLKSLTMPRPGRLLSSGHRAPDARGRRAVGLIRSLDHGANWTAANRAGAADFHALQSRGSVIYGYDAARLRLMVSRDGGAHWRSRRLRPLAGLAIHPTSSPRVAVSTSRGVQLSGNSGRTFRTSAASPSHPGLLAWPRPSALILVDPSGVVSRSADGGDHFRRVGTLPGRPAALVASGHVLYAALIDGSVFRSDDGGRRWARRSLAFIDGGPHAGPVG